MNESTAIRWDQDEDGIVVLTLDDPEHSTNTMNAAFRESLAATLERLEAEKDSIAGVVITVPFGFLCQTIAVTWYALYGRRTRRRTPPPKLPPGTCTSASPPTKTCSQACAARPRGDRGPIPASYPRPPHPATNLASRASAQDCGPITAKLGSPGIDVDMVRAGLFA